MKLFYCILINTMLSSVQQFVDKTKLYSQKKTESGKFEPRALFEASGFNQVSGYHKINSSSKSSQLKPLNHLKPIDEFRASKWVSTKPQFGPCDKLGIDLNQAVWVKRRTRDNQYGLKSSEGVHGSEWYPVSNVEGPKQELDVSPEASDYNINSSAYTYGRAEQTMNLGKDLKGEKKILIRGKGDLLFTKGRRNNLQEGGKPFGLNKNKFF